MTAAKDSGKEAVLAEFEKLAQEAIESVARSMGTKSGTAPDATASTDHSYTAFSWFILPGTGTPMRVVFARGTGRHESTYALFRSLEFDKSAVIGENMPPKPIQEMATLEPLTTSYDLSTLIKLVNDAAHRPWTSSNAPTNRSIEWFHEFISAVNRAAINCSFVRLVSIVTASLGARRRSVIAPGSTWGEVHGGPHSETEGAVFFLAPIPAAVRQVPDCLLASVLCLHGGFPVPHRGLTSLALGMAAPQSAIGMVRQVVARFHRLPHDAPELLRDHVTTVGRPTHVHVVEEHLPQLGILMQVRKTDSPPSGASSPDRSGWRCHLDIHVAERREGELHGGRGGKPDVDR